MLKRHKMSRSPWMKPWLLPTKSLGKWWNLTPPSSLLSKQKSVPWQTTLLQPSQAHTGWKTERFSHSWFSPLCGSLILDCFVRFGTLPQWLDASKLMKNQPHLKTQWTEMLRQIFKPSRRKIWRNSAYLFIVSFNLDSQLILKKFKWINQNLSSTLFLLLTLVKTQCFSWDLRSKSNLSIWKSKLKNAPSQTNRSIKVNYIHTHSSIT